MTPKIRKALQLGKVKGAKVLLTQYYLKQDKEIWLVSKEEEYHELFPKFRLMREDEWSSDTDLLWSVLSEEYKAELFVPIDYKLYDKDSNPIGFSKDYKTFDEYLSETKVLQEFQEATYDADGKIITDEVQEVTELVRLYVASDVADKVNAYIRQSTIPKEVTMRQARLALLEHNLLSTVDEAINNSNDQAMQIEWGFATEIRRDWVSLIALTESMGIDSDTLDDLFILAKEK